MYLLQPLVEICGVDDASLEEHHFGVEALHQLGMRCTSCPRPTTSRPVLETSQPSACSQIGSPQIRTVVRAELGTPKIATSSSSCLTSAIAVGALVTKVITLKYSARGARLHYPAVQLIPPVRISATAVVLTEGTHYGAVVATFKRPEGRFRGPRRRQSVGDINCKAT